MKTKLLVLATLIATSIACFAMVDAFDRHSKRAQAADEAASLEKFHPSHAQADAAANPQVARLLTNCTGMPLVQTEVGATPFHAAMDATSTAGAAACCGGSEASSPIAEHACCAAETAPSLVATESP